MTVPPLQLSIHLPFSSAGFHLPVYGLCFSLAFLAAIGLAHHRAAGLGLDTDRLSDLYLVIIVSSLIGARTLFVCLEWKRFVAQPLEAIRFWRGGLVFYGGLIGAFVSSMVYVRKTGLSIPEIADLAAPSLALGQAIGRLGCFANGCCFGQPSTLPWACHAAAFDMTLRHPTQLYESLGLFGILCALLLAARKRPRHGTLAAGYAILYAALRFSIECLRGDDRGGFFAGGLSISQLISVGTLALGLAAGCFLATRPRDPREA